METNNDMAEFTNDANTLVAYRLGRLEKQVEETNRTSKAQHESLLLRFDDINKINQTVNEHKLRIQMLEKSRERLISAISVVGTGTLMLAIQQLLGVIGGK